MSQIAGILRLDGQPPTPEERELQMAPLRRSPHDREGAWSHGPAAFGHFALDVTDEDRLERQPLVHEPTETCLVWDGRLDNREELFRALPELQRKQLAATTDTDLVLHAWLRWGRDSPKRLVGDFAYAVCDGKSGELFLARDRIGMRPLYYARTGSTFAFASQIKGVRSLSGVDRGLDEDWVADYLSLTHLSTTSTAYLGIRRLPAAHWIVVSAAGKVTLRRYWSLLDEREARFGTDEEYHDNLREVTRRAVHDRMRGSGPIGSMLSGGLDSSTVTAFACHRARAENRRVVTISSVLPDDHVGPETDERQQIRSFLEMYPECDWIPVTQRGVHPLCGLDRVIDVFDQPIRDLYQFRMFAVFDRLASLRVRSVMTGLGGDWHASAAVPASTQVAALTLRIQWAELGKYYRHYRESAPGRSAAGFFRQKLIPALVGVGILRSTLEKLGVAGRRDRFLPMLGRSEARRMRIEQRLRALAVDQSRSPWRSSLVNERRIVESGMTAHVVECVAAYGFGSGLRIQMPLLDWRVVASVAALPIRLRREPAISRTPMRRISSGIVPKIITDRRDKGVFWPDADRQLEPLLQDQPITKQSGEIHARAMTIYALELLKRTPTRP